MLAPSRRRRRRTACRIPASRLLDAHLKALRLPTFLREYDKVARHVPREAWTVPATYSACASWSCSIANNAPSSAALMAARFRSLDVVCRTCTPPGRRDPSGSERLTTGVGAAWLVRVTSWDGPRAAAGQVSPRRANQHEGFGRRCPQPHSTLERRTGAGVCQLGHMAEGGTGGDFGRCSRAQWNRMWVTTNEARSPAPYQLLSGAAIRSRNGIRHPWRRIVGTATAASAS